MTLGIPKEVHDGEKRVATTPEVATQLTQLGYTVAVERGAARVVAVDPDARKAFATYRHPRVRFVVAYADAVAGTFDVVTLFDVLCRVPVAEWDGLLATAFERLRPGGAVQREMSVRTTGVFGHRLYAGITTGHFMAHTVPFVDPAIVLSGFFGHTEEDLELFGEQLPPFRQPPFVEQRRLCVQPVFDIGASPILQFAHIVMLRSEAVAPASRARRRAGAIRPWCRRPCRRRSWRRPRPRA